ncbi:hypothetical protein HELRODRAFT_67265, partial [Helobdella robusta]|uniref:Radial spoke head protein 3 n=1 Tax=Helobdella robusta TaxID=6412 RepID=T1FYZ0_HELRO
QKSFSRKSRTNFWDRRTPEPVEGRQHMEMQTELYLEEFGDMIEEVNQGCQTDPFINKPPTPMFVPAKIGIDASTQIFDGDLFDFDVEVRPMVEVLIGKVLEQSLMEVMEEEELASLRERQRMFEEMRNAELQEQQRLEEEDRRRKDEKLKRMKHQQELIRKEKETAEKIAAKAFAQSFLSDLVPSVVASLSENGYFHDPIEAELEKNFMEDLMRGVCKRLRYEVISRKLIDRIIKKIVRQREEQYLKSLEKKKQDSENDDERDDNSNDDDEFDVKRSRNKANSGREHEKVDGHIKKGHAVGGSYRY